MNHAAVSDVVTGVVEPLGLEVDRLEFAAAGRRTVVRIYLDGDGPQGRGPSLDDIADATRAISQALDDSPATGQAPYVLEVSSRGVGRPLTEPKHYRRSTGRLVALTRAEGEKVRGRITAVDDEAVTLEVDGAERRVGYPDISKAVVQVELASAAGDEDDAAGVEEGE